MNLKLNNAPYTQRTLDPDGWWRPTAITDEDSNHISACRRFFGLAAEFETYLDGGRFLPTHLKNAHEQFSFQAVVFKFIPLGSRHILEMEMEMHKCQGSRRKQGVSEG